jgi:hypothetical protein
MGAARFRGPSTKASPWAMADAAGREFFTTRTVADALAGFRPRRRTGTETVPLAAPGTRRAGHGAAPVARVRPFHR